MWYLNKGLVSALDEAANGVVNLVNLSHMATSCSALALCDDMDASSFRWDMIPFSFLGARAP